MDKFFDILHCLIAVINTEENTKNKISVWNLSELKGFPENLSKVLAVQFLSFPDAVHADHSLDVLFLDIAPAVHFPKRVLEHGLDFAPFEVVVLVGIVLLEHCFYDEVNLKWRKGWHDESLFIIILIGKYFWFIHGR